MTEEITQDEAMERLSKYETEELRVKLEGNSVMVRTSTDVTFEFVSLQDEPEMIVNGDTVWTTVSEFLIHEGEETYEVETDGPFKLNMEAALE